MEMIALDGEPFTIVKHVGFARLLKMLEPRYTLPSDTYLRETLLPDIYTAVKERLRTVVDTATFVSLTTDAWTTPQCKESLISFTCHWIDNDWKRRQAG